MIEKYVTSKNPSQRLHDLSFKIESEYYWVRYHLKYRDNFKFRIVSVVEQIKLQLHEEDENTTLFDLESIPAYLVGELMEVLQKYLSVNDLFCKFGYIGKDIFRIVNKDKNLFIE